MINSFENLNTKNTTSNLSQYLYIYRYPIFIGLFVLNILLFWPGFPTPDSQSQYQQAIIGVYSDHHPPMMSFIWHYIYKIWPGFTPIYLLQLVTLYLGFFIILRTAETFIDFKKQPWLLLLVFLAPWLPQILLYNIQIQKDNHFTFSYLIVGAILANYTLKPRKIPTLVALLISILLIYGTAVKYQAQFCMPLLSIWFGCLLVTSNSKIKKAAAGIATTLMLYAAISNINTFLVPQSHKSHAWEYVKLFDLAAVSKATNQDLIPSFNKTPTYTFEKLKDRFQSSAVDPYIYSNDNIFTKTDDPKEQDKLWSDWAKAATSHPLVFLKHRLTNLTYSLLGRVGYSHVDSVLSRLITPETSLYSFTRAIIDVLGYIFFIPLWSIILGFIYFVSSLFYWKKSRFAPIVFSFSGMAILLVSILLFMSMAGTPRYVYFSVVMINACHLFAIGMYRDRFTRG